MLVPKPLSLLLAGGALAPEGPLMCRGSPAERSVKDFGDENDQTSAVMSEGDLRFSFLVLLALVKMFA